MAGVLVTGDASVSGLGTVTYNDGKRVLANGGRVLNVTAMAATVEEARNRAYRAVDLIDWPEGFCRRDIAWRATARRP